MSKGPYKHHPFSEIFPFREGTSLDALSDNMKKNGQHEEIVLYQGMVLNGRRRQAAAKRAGIKPLYRQYGSRPTDGPNPLDWAFDINFHLRDDMTHAEKELAAIKLARFKKGYNPPTGGLGEKPMTLGEAAKRMGVPKRRVERRKAVLDNGVQELIDVMDAEKVTVSDAAAIAGQPPIIQKKAVEAVVSGRATTLQAAVEDLVPATAAPESLPRFCAGLADLIERAPRLVTPKVPARDLATKALTQALGLFRKL
jgi:hypothetical protein